MKARCQCKCGGCPGIVTEREQRSSMNRCIACREEPGPTCKRVQRTFEPRIGVLCGKAERHPKPHDLHFRKVLSPRIEAQLDRLHAKRRAKSFVVGSAGGNGTAAGNSAPRAYGKQNERGAEPHFNKGDV